MIPVTTPFVTTATAVAGTNPVPEPPPSSVTVGKVPICAVATAPEPPPPVSVIGRVRGVAGAGGGDVDRGDHAVDQDGSGCRAAAATARDRDRGHARVARAAARDRDPGDRAAGVARAAARHRNRSDHTAAGDRHRAGRRVHVARGQWIDELADRHRVGAGERVGQRLTRQELRRGRLARGHHRLEVDLHQRPIGQRRRGRAQERPDLRGTRERRRVLVGDAAVVGRGQGRRDRRRRRRVEADRQGRRRRAGVARQVGLDDRDAVQPLRQWQRCGDRVGAQLPGRGGDRDRRGRGVPTAGVGDGQPGDHVVHVHHGGCRRTGAAAAGDRDRRQSKT